mgnify:FL=1
MVVGSVVNDSDGGYEGKLMKNRWPSEKIDENQWKSMKIDENSVKINEIDDDDDDDCGGDGGSSSILYLKTPDQPPLAATMLYW